ncbi:MAG TPA: response regulator [Nitrospinota bacterium]|nr:response regulator [Nitrospinota bacterium]
MNNNKILVVDNELEILNVLQDVLNILGYAPVVVTSGKDALEIFEKGKFSLVITDMVMPDINGLDLLKEIKKLDSNIPVVIITGFGSEVIEEAIQAGADGYIEKPFKIEDIKNILEKNLR